MRKESFKIKRLNIAHEDSLARGLGYHADDLLMLAETARDFYKPFPLHPKQRPFAKKPPKKSRPIDNPTGSLKQAQNRIREFLLSPVVLPDHIFGAARYRSIIGNAQCHHGASLLVTLDIRQCFQASRTHMFTVCGRIFSDAPPPSPVSSRNSQRLTDICLKERQQAQCSRTCSSGPSTGKSAMHAHNWCGNSTWIDDLAFSGDKARDVIQVVVRTLKRNGLRLSHRKSRSWEALNLSY